MELKNLEKEVENAVTNQLEYIIGHFDAALAGSNNYKFSKILKHDENSLNQSLLEKLIASLNSS